MKIFDKKYEIKIEEDDLKDAKLSSIDFSNQSIKKRAFINILGARLAMKQLFSQHIEANNLYSLYTIHSVLEEIDIADIYFQGIKIDVRLVFNNEEIFIPKSHFEYNLLPDLYLVLNIKQDMSSAEFLGFFEPDKLDKKNENKNFYFYEFENLHKQEELKEFLEDFIVENKFKVSEDSRKQSEELFLSLIDKEISKEDKVFLFQQLAHNFSLREKMVEVENFEFISKEVAKNTELLQDSVLDVVGAQNAVEEGPLSDFEEKREINEAINGEQSGTVKMGLDSLIAEAESSVYLPEEEVEIIKDSASSETIKANEIIEGGLHALAAGLTLGSVIAENEAHAVSAGIELGSDIVKSGADAIFSELGNINDFSVEIEPEDFDLESEKNETEFELSNLELEGEIQEKELPEFEFQNDYSIEEKEDDNELENFTAQEFLNEDFVEDSSGFEPENEIQEETISEEYQPEIKEQEGDIFAELPEIGNLYELGEFQPPEYLSQNNDVEKITGKEDGDILSLDDFDMLNNKENENEHQLIEQSIATEDDLVSFDETATLEEEPKLEEINEMTELKLSDDTENLQSEYKPENYNETDTMPKIMDLSLEEDEENFEDKQSRLQAQPDDLLSEVDDFLNNMDFLEEPSAELSEKNLSKIEEFNDFSEFDLENTQKEAKPKISASTDEALETSIDELLSQTELQKDITQIDEAEEDSDLLKVLFKKENFEEKIEENFDSDEDMNFEKRTKPTKTAQNKKMIIAASIASVVIASVVIGGITINNRNNAVNSPNNMTIPLVSATAQPPNNLTNDMSQPNDINQPSQTNQPTNVSEQIAQQPAAQAPLVVDQQAETNRDMGKAVSDAFLSEPVNASISKIAWEVPEDLAYNDSFRKYLQIAGKNLKLNLQNNLLLATEMAYSNKVIVDLEISKDGALRTSNIVVSSGSKQIDKIVLQSINETIKYLKMPSSEISGQSVIATLIINF